MKPSIYALLALLLTASCQKEAALTDTKKALIDLGCISQTTTLPRLSPADSVIAFGLFNANNINTDSLVLYEYHPYWQANDDLVYGYYQEVSATQVKNGLPVLFGDVSVQFGDGYSNRLTGKYNFTIALPHKPSFQYTKLRQLFLDEGINNQGMAASYKDSCFTAQFGYFNLDKVTSSATPDFVTA